MPARNIAALPPVSLVSLPAMLVAAILLASVAPAGAAPCAPDPRGDLLCGEGTSAPRITPNTASPDKRFAFGWRLKAGKPAPADYPNPQDVENVLVRLADGAVLAAIGGKGWNLGPMHASLYESYASWSADSRAVVETASDKRETYALTYVALEDGDKAATLDLLSLVLPAATAKLRRRDRDEYVMRVRYDDPATFEAGGRLRIGVVFSIPARGHWTFFDVTLLMSRSGGAPAAKVVAVKRTKGK
jgi:hypothetical protein